MSSISEVVANTRCVDNFSRYHFSTTIRGMGASLGTGFKKAEKSIRWVCEKILGRSGGMLMFGSLTAAVGVE